MKFFGTRASGTPGRNVRMAGEGPFAVWAKLWMLAAAAAEVMRKLRRDIILLQTLQLFT